jgi:hypothetical protein
VVEHARHNQHRLLENASHAGSYPLKKEMAAADNLDYNQVQEQSPSTGDTPSKSGGLLTWNFRADPNLAWDPSQSFFVMEFTVKTFTAKTNGNNTGWTNKYIPDAKDFYAFFPLRLFSAMSHIVDGVTVAHSNQPWADKIMQEKYLMEQSRSNNDNWESLVLARNIDDGIPDHNMFMAQSEVSTTSVFDTAREYTMQYNRHRIRDITQVSKGSYNVMFQPPFDLWTKHQRISGGNHQIQLNMFPAVQGTDATDAPANSYWGSYCITPEAGLQMITLANKVFDGTYRAFRPVEDPNANPVVEQTYGTVLFENVAANTHKEGNPALTGAFVDTLIDSNIGGHLGAFYSERFRSHAFNTYYQSGTPAVQLDIHSIRLMRRMVRTTIERPLGIEEFGTTEMAFFHGTSTTSEQTQNFLLPASTFAVAFYWRSSVDSYYAPFDNNRKFTFGNTGNDNSAAGFLGASGILEDGAAVSTMQYPSLELDQFYFTYGGETYPAQRIQNIYNGVPESRAPGAIKMQTLTHMLHGAMNTDQDRFNAKYSGEGILDRVDANGFLFPVAKHNNSDNSDLQVYFKANPSYRKELYKSGAVETSQPSQSVSLVVVAFYDANLQLSYNAANQLEKVNKIEWK